MLMPSSPDQQERRLNWAISTICAPAKHRYCLLKSSGQPTESPPASYPHHEDYHHTFFPPPPQRPIQGQLLPPVSDACPDSALLARYQNAIKIMVWLCHPLRSASCRCGRRTRSHMSALARGLDRRVPQFHRSIVGALCRCL